MAVEWLMFSSSAIFCVVVRGSAWTIAVNSLLSTSAVWPLHSSSLTLCLLQNFLNHHCTVCSLAVYGLNVLLMLRVVSAALQPILNFNKKIAQLCFFIEHHFPI